MGFDTCIVPACKWYDMLSDEIYFSIDKYFSQLIKVGRCIYASVNLTIIASDNGLSPVRCQAINCSNAGLLLIGLMGTNFSEIFINMKQISHKKLSLKISSEIAGNFVSVSMCWTERDFDTGIHQGCYLIPVLFQYTGVVAWHWMAKLFFHWQVIFLKHNIICLHRQVYKSVFTRVVIWYLYYSSKHERFPIKT